MYFANHAEALQGIINAVIPGKGAVPSCLQGKQLARSFWYRYPQLLGQGIKGSLDLAAILTDINARKMRSEKCHSIQELFHELHEDAIVLFVQIRKYLVQGTAELHEIPFLLVADTLQDHLFDVHELLVHP